MFNPRNPDVFTVIRSNMPILQNDDKMQDILQKIQLFKAIEN